MLAGRVVYAACSSILPVKDVFRCPVAKLTITYNNTMTKAMMEFLPINQ